MERGRISRGDDSSDGGVPTPGARRARVATAAAALVLAAALTVYAVWVDESRGLAALAGIAGIALILVALLVAWDDGLVAGASLLLVAYALSLADRGEALDRAAPLVAVALLAVVEFGSWSLELRDGAEERPLARLPQIGLLLLGAAAASTLVVMVGGVRTDAGLALWALGAAAAIGLLVLIAQPVAKRS
jgi:hypothetical protein